MSEPVWIRPDIVRAVHLRQLAEHGGGVGVRDEGLLSSALDRPKNLYGYGNPPPSLPEIAASYAYGIARNHPFIDGNKRTAFIVCRLFLKLNGADINAPQEDKYFIFLKLAAGEITEEELALWIKKHMIMA